VQKSEPSRIWPTLAARGDLTPAVVALGTRLLGRVSKAESAIGPSGPVALVHGDASLDNMRTGQLRRVAVTSWRQARADNLAFGDTPSGHSATGLAGGRDSETASSADWFRSGLAGGRGRRGPYRRCPSRNQTGEVRDCVRQGETRSLDHRLHSRRSAGSRGRCPPESPPKFGRAGRTSRRRFHALLARGEFLTWILDDASEQDAAAVLTEIPPPTRLVYRWVLRPRYDAQHRWRIPSTTAQA